MARKKKEEGSQFVRYFGPLLDALRRLGGSGTPDEVVEQIAQDLGLPDEVQNDLLPSGQPRYRNQVAWARFYLVREGLLDSSKRGVWSLTDRGRETTLSAEQAREVFLKWVRIFQEQRREKEQTAEPVEEQVAEGTGATPNDYRAAAIELLLSLPPAGFERLSQRLLREAGFTQVVVTGSSGDGGIDGYGTLHEENRGQKIGDRPRFPQNGVQPGRCNMHAYIMDRSTSCRVALASPYPTSPCISSNAETIAKPVSTPKRITVGISTGSETALQSPVAVFTHTS